MQFEVYYWMEGQSLLVLKKLIIKILMLQQNQFANITHLFYSGEYQQGEKQISAILRRETNNSNLYVNRALFLSQLGRDEQAIVDLQQALKVNPRNYIAYFNLFSILTKIVQDEQAFSNLCCSLSCMYLIRAKVYKSIDDVNIAISYSQNNYEAHVLKGLLLLQNNQYQQAKGSFENALNLVPNNQVVVRLRNITIQKGNLSIEPFISSNISNELQSNRLINSYIMVDGCDINDQIESKLAQFNKLYIDINTTAGTVTQKVTKDSHLSNRNSQQNIKIIYDSGLSTPHKTSEVHPQPGNVYIRSSLVREEENMSFVSCKREERLEYESFISLNHEEEKEEIKVQGSFAKQHFSDLPKKQEIAQVKEEQNKQGFESIISQKEHLQQPSNIEQQGQSQHYNLIYPLDDNMKLRISVLNLQFLQLTQQLQQNLTDVYCIINYNNGKSKLKTAAKPTQGQKCYWNQQFQPVNISEDPAYMKIKIYNKKYKSVRDEFLGDLEVLITTADLLKLPLYSKNGILGNLLLHLQLVEIVPPPIVDRQEQQDRME